MVILEEDLQVFKVFHFEKKERKKERRKERKKERRKKGKKERRKEGKKERRKERKKNRLFYYYLFADYFIFGIKPFARTFNTHGVPFVFFNNVSQTEILNF